MGRLVHHDKIIINAYGGMPYFVLDCPHNMRMEDIYQEKLKEKTIKPHGSMNT